MTEGMGARQVLGTRLGAQGARGACEGRAGGSWALRRWASGQARRARAGGLGAGRVVWAGGLAKAVHLVHSACFWPGSTRYFS